MGTSPPSLPLADLPARLRDLMPRDRHRLRRRIDGARNIGDERRRAAVAEQISADIDAATARLASRRTSVPPITYPESLPIAGKRDEIMAAIRDHQVVIVAGETGSGKTTQLPKMCLELGRGVSGLIGHTQPRRLAARTVADRIAEELGTATGTSIGFKVRFTDQVSDATLVKVMTDGILLAEIQNDRRLYQYDTLIIDEAHERSLNIDFILGYLKQLLPRRPDLKVIITSATIDPERFSRHFDDAPVIEVSGRAYPVEVRYRPLSGEPARPGDPEGGDDPDDEALVVSADRDQTDAICDAVRELSAEGPGDILVFLSGEREIRDTADAVTRMELRNTEIMPLFARLSAAEQHRVFRPHTGRRIVLATNVAETSLTVPGIRYVIDPGTARISRFGHRTKVQRLPIEPISQASANQRKGRCGRLSDGICIRLYSEADFASRPEFTDPEILRTSLAAVILSMAAIGLGDIAAFPFMDPPDRRNISDGIALLRELGALDGRDKLTPVGRKLAQLPVDPRLGRMVLESERYDCAAEVLVIAAALSIQDPRERPLDKQQAADEKHARFAAPDSDFLGYLNLWRYLREQQKTLSSSQFRRLCRTDFLNYLRVREWQDIYGQLRQIAATLGIHQNREPAEPANVHRALLAGLLSHLGTRDAAKQDYLGARGARFAIFPGSVLFRRSPQWVMAAELVETSRLWARITARIEPEWAEELAGHLVKRQYSEPHWEAKRGAVTAFEKVTLYGLPIVASRKVNYGPIDPELSRELFIRHALVEGDWQTRHPFFEHNQTLRERVEDLEHRARRRDILVDDQVVFDFYDARVPPDVVSAAHFDAWWKKARRTQPELLNLELSMLINEGTGGLRAEDFPDAWRLGDLRLPLTYQFEPGTAADGVTVHVPLPVLGQLSPDGFDWQVPGLREELVTALIRSLPKQVRREFVPVPDWARAALSGMSPDQGPLLDVLGRALLRMSGVPVPPDAWQVDRVPPHLRVTFRIEDERGDSLAEGKDLVALRRSLRDQMRESLSSTAGGLEREDIRGWDVGTVPESVVADRGGYRVTAYPALTDEGGRVALRLYPSAAEQRVAMRKGTRRLLMLGLPSAAALVRGRLSNQAKMALLRSPYPNVADLLDDCLGAAIDRLVAGAGGPSFDEEGFRALREKVRPHLSGTLLGIVESVRHTLAVAYELEQRLSGTPSPLLAPALADIRAQLSGLVYPGFVTDTGADRLAELPRYLTAIARRLDKLPESPARDRERMETVAEVRSEYERLREELRASGRTDEATAESLDRIRWMIEELRVNLFAQALGTPYPISDKRVYRAMDDLAA